MFVRWNIPARVIVTLGVTAGVLALGSTARGQRDQNPPQVASEPSQDTTTVPAPATIPAPAKYTSAIRANNIGMALMDEQQFGEALGRFQTACVMDLDSDAGCLNMGIALLNMKQYDDARKILEKSAERDPQNPRAWFNLALLERAASQLDDVPSDAVQPGATQPKSAAPDAATPDAAMSDFQKVAAIDPNDADTQYWIGLLHLEKKRYGPAIAAFEQALELNPFHASAEFSLERALRESGDVDDAIDHLNRYQHITEQNLGRPIGTAYGAQGKYSRAEELTAGAQPAQPSSSVAPVHFVNVTSLSGLPAQFTSSGTQNRIAKAAKAIPAADSAGALSAASPTVQSLGSFLGSGACIIDYDGDGKPDIFLVNGDGKGDAALFRNLGGGKFINVTKEVKLEFHGDGTSCAVGDYDNDGHPDLAVGSAAGLTLFHNEAGKSFKDVTEAAGVHTGGLVLGITFIDYDRDGDLDLYVTRFNDSPLENPVQPFSFTAGDAPGNILWRNKGDGTFLDWTQQTALVGAASSVGAIGSDLTNGGDIDVIVTGWQKTPSIFVNPREGAFRSVALWSADMPGPTAGAVSFDFDKDGWMDLAFTHWSPPGFSLWRNVDGKSFGRVTLPGPVWMRGWGIAAIDYDNDGWIDLVMVGETFSGEGRILLLRNEGANGFRDVTHETGLDKIALHNPRGVTVFDFDGDGAPGLLITQNNLPPVLLKNSGGNKNNWIALSLEGEEDNRNAIGTKIEIFAGDQRQKWEVAGASGYLGQGPSEILLGLGEEDEADVVRIFWPGGLLQDELSIAGGKLVPLAETDRLTSH